MNIQEAIELMKTKDEKGLVFIYDNYATALMGIILRIIGSEKVAEEILQQTFMKVWSKIESYNKDKSSFFTWMARIARNAAIDQVRLKSYQHERNTTSINPQLAENGFVLSHAGLDVEKLIRHLDEKHKTVLETVYLKGYTHKEAADLLNIPIGTIKTRLRHSILTLRSSIKKEGLMLSAGLALLILTMLTIWS